MRKSFLKLIESKDEDSFTVPENGESITNPIEIAFIFSLCTLLKLNARSFLKKRLDSSEKTEITFIPFGNSTEFDLLNFKATTTEKNFYLRKNEAVYISIEIFQTSYQFESFIHETENAETSQSQYSILPPEKISIQRLRRYPRKWFENEIETVCINDKVEKILEIGPDSIVVTNQHHHDLKKDFHLQFFNLKEREGNGSGKFEMYFIRGDSSSLILKNKNNKEPYFKEYIKLIYKDTNTNHAPLRRLMSHEKVATYISPFYENENIMDSAYRYLIEIESLLIEEKEDFEYLVLYSTESKDQTRLWNKFSQNSVRHRFIFSKGLKEVVTNYPVGSFCDTELAHHSMRMISIKKSELLLLYSSIQYYLFMRDEAQNTRKSS